MLHALKFSLNRSIVWKNRISLFQYYSSIENKKQCKEANDKYDIYALVNHLKSAPSLINALTTFSNISKEDHIYENLKMHKHFEVLNALLQNSSCQEPMNMLTTPSLINKSLSDTATNNEKNLLSYKMSIIDCNLLYDFFSKCQAFQTRTAILYLLEEKMVEIVKEIDCFSDMLFVYKNSATLPKQILSHANEIMQDKCKDFTCNNLVILIVALGRAKVIDKSLLFTLTYYLLISESEMSVGQIINVFCALFTLNYQDNDLLEKLASELATKVNTITNASQISTVLQPIKGMRYKNIKVLEAISTWIAMNAEKCKVRHLSIYLKTLAKLNYVPQNFNDIYNIILPILRHDLEDNPLGCISWVLSLIIINKADKEVIRSVLRKPVYDFLLSQADFNIMENKYIKNISKNLLSINFVAKNMKEYDQEILPPDIVSTLLSKVEFDQKSAKLSILQQIFEPKALAYNVPTPFGIMMGAEFILDSNKNSLPLEDYITECANVPLPEGARRIAAMYWTHWDYCYKSEELTGFAILAKHLLQENGYTVLEIPHFELHRWNDKQNVDIIRNKIKQL